MAISELWVPETLICLFLVLPLFRPYFKALWPLDGLVWLPLIALLITAGIFPAYGFRPECLPILLFALVYNAANLGSVVSSIKSQPSDAFRDRSIVLTVFAFITLGAAVFTMYAFSPRIDGYPKTETELRRTSTTLSGGFGRHYCLQIYGQAGRPIIFLVPPEIGASASVELVCLELENKGYTVVTYSRKDFDLPFVDQKGKKHFSLLAKMPGYLYAFAMGTRLASANNRGKAMEAERQTDIEYLLPRIYGLTGETGHDELPPILLAGYGAGGSALAYLNARGVFASNNNVLGIVAVENRLWSSYQAESPADPWSSSMRKLIDIVDHFPDLSPKTLKRAEVLPSANLPVLYLVSGKALKYPLLDYDGRRKNPYQAVFDTQRSASGPIAIAAIVDSGPLDYHDFPLTHPFYSFLLSGKRDANNPISDTAGIIGNFASLLIEQSVQAHETQAETENDDFQQPVTIIPPRSPISGRLYVESKAMDWLKL
ncbi:MAG: hypothetical protein LBU85_05965 [Treponema sp.]|jgi:hypothetical protein|nr:hypothetical protein [Treponema sp.]